MFLKKLIIKTEQGKIIREVSFKKGMNIILGIQDESGSDSGSTNSLGKTTLLRCIDFCLGAQSLNEIYTDPEFKGSINKEVESFLRKVNPIFTLEVAPSFNSENFISIERHVNLNKRTKYINFINGNKISKKNFENIELKKIFFDLSEEKPRFRSLIGKFIRKNETSLSNILKYANIYTSDLEYEKIYLFLMGFHSSKLLSEKAITESKLKKNQSILNAFKENNGEVSQLQQSLYLIENELSELNNLRDEYKINTKYNAEEELLKKVQLSLRKIEGEIASLKLKKEINLERKSKIETEFISIESQSLKYLYDEAKYFNDSLPRTLDELVQFHNKMISNEIDYLNKSLEKYTFLITDKEQAKLSFVNKYNELLSFFGKSGSLAEYTKLNEKISTKYMILGEISLKLKNLSLYTDTVESLQSELDLINKKINSLEPELDKNLKIFNKYFSEYTAQLTNYKHLLSYKKKNKQYQFKINNVDSNLGSGQKQAMIIAFDLAYISFCDEVKLTRPHFITQDKVEIIDEKILKSLFSIADRINGQLIVPIIWDKFKDEYPNIKNDSILELSPSNKFFCIEQFSN